MLILDLLVVGTLFCWFVCSILAQRRPTRMFTFDPGGLLPNYRFFAPRPISFDLYLVTRTSDRDSKGTWEFYDVSQKSLGCLVWNPHHRLRKGITDLVGSLRRAANSAHIHLTHPYLVLLNLTVNRYGNRPDVNGVQFALVRSYGYERSSLEMFFISNIHASRP
jgi:hypothetical protein